MALWIGLLVVGIAVFALGWRGWRVGDVPHCRKCGYELSGIESREACPECGRGLAVPRAVARGRRRRRPVVAGVGGLLALAGVLVAGYQVVLTTQNLPMAKRPIWLLELDVKSPVDERADAAIAELGVRRLAGNYANKRYAAYSELALDRHGIAGDQWVSSPWQDVLIVAHATEQLTETQIDRALRQQFKPEVFEPWQPDQRAIDPDDVYAGGFALNSGFRAAMAGDYLIVANPVRATMNGTAYPLAPEPMYGDEFRVFVTGVSVMGDLDGRTGSMMHNGIAVPRAFNILRYGDLAPGLHEFDVDYEIEIRAGSSVHNADWEADPLLAFPLHARRTVHIIEDPSDVLEYADSSSRIPRPNLDVMASWPNTARAIIVAPSYSDGWIKLSYQIERNSQPGDRAHIAHACSLEINGTRYPLRQSEHARDITRVPLKPSDMPVGQAHSLSQGFQAYFRADELPRVDSAKIVLVPDPEYAVINTDADVFWNEEIVIEGVQLDWSAIDAPEDPET